MAKILIADDHPQNREYLVDLLRHCGHDLLEADDGAEALERVQADHPDLVIADLLMPTMDGYELVRRIRGDPAIAGTPVIFHSAAYDEGEVRPLASACGVTHILRKPAQPETVLDLVGSVLGTAQRPVPDPPPLAEFDREHLRLLTDKLSQKADALEEANARLNMLIELGRELGLERHPEQLLEHACHSARAILDAESAALGVLDESRSGVSIPLPQRTGTRTRPPDVIVPSPTRGIPRRGARVRSSPSVAASLRNPSSACRSPLRPCSTACSTSSVSRARRPSPTRTSAWPSPSHPRSPSLTKTRYGVMTFSIKPRCCEQEVAERQRSEEQVRDPERRARAPRPGAHGRAEPLQRRAGAIRLRRRA